MVDCHQPGQLLRQPLPESLLGCMHHIFSFPAMLQLLRFELSTVFLIGERLVNITWYSIHYITHPPRRITNTIDGTAIFYYQYALRVLVNLLTKKPHLGPPRRTLPQPR